MKFLMVNHFYYGFRLVKGCKCTSIITVAFNSPVRHIIIIIIKTGRQFIKSTLTSLMFASTQ